MRLSSLEDSSTPSSRSISPIPAPVGLAARFSYRETNTPNPLLDQSDVVEIGSSEDEEKEDELEMLERKILENRKRKRQNQIQQQKHKNDQGR